MKRFLLVLALFICAVGAAFPGEGQWLVYLRASDNTGTNNSTICQIGDIDFNDAVAPFMTDFPKYLAWVVTEDSGTVYSNFFTSAYSWRLFIAGNQNYSDSIIRLRIYTDANTSYLPPSSCYSLLMINNRGISGAPANGTRWVITPTAPDATCLDITLPVAKGSLDASMIQQIGYEMRFIRDTSLPQITGQPAGLTRNIGESASFQVTANGNFYNYQWRKDGSNISGATFSSYTIGSVSVNDAGAYSCVVTNGCGSVTSNNANLVVNSGMRVADAKKLSDGQPASLSGKPVTAVFGSAFYIEEPDREIGLRVEKSGHALTIGSKADVSGTMATGTNGERYLSATAAAQNGTGVVDPIFLINKGIGGANWYYAGTAGQKGIKGGTGLNNIGLLISVFGRITRIDSLNFTLDDGSGVNVKCALPEGITLNAGWTYAFVTGISSCEKSGTDLNRLILVRMQSDIIGY